MDRLDLPRVESSSEAPGHLRASSVLCWKSLLALMYSYIFYRSFSKVCRVFLAKYCAVGPGQSPLIMASITISFASLAPEL
jgi:hypothetical protein